mgnify:CR=1 FL=1
MRRTRTCRSTCPDSSASRSTPKLNDSIKRDKHHADTHASRRRPRRRRHRPRSHGRGAEGHGRSGEEIRLHGHPRRAPGRRRRHRRLRQAAARRNRRGLRQGRRHSVRLRGRPEVGRAPARVPPRSGRAASPEKALRTLLQPASGPLLRRPRGPLAPAPRHRRKGLRHGLRARAHGRHLLRSSEGPRRRGRGRTCVRHRNLHPRRSEAHRSSPSRSPATAAAA